MFVPSDQRSTYLRGLGAIAHMDRRKRYLTGLLSRGTLGVGFDPRTKYLSGPRRRRGLLGLGQDGSDFDTIDSWAGLDSSSSMIPTVTNASGTFEVPFTGSPSNYFDAPAPSLNQPISAIPTTRGAADAQVLADVPPGYAINSSGNLVNASTGQVVNPAVQAAQTAAAAAQVGGAVAQYVNSAGQVVAVPPGYAVGSNGQLVASASPLAGLSAWLNSSTLFSGTLNSSVLLYGALGFAAFSLISNKKKKR